MWVRPLWWDSCPYRKRKRPALSLCHVRTQKAATRKPGGGPSVGAWPYCALSLDFPTSRTMRNEYLLFKPPSLWNFRRPRRLKQALNAITSILVRERGRWRQERRRQCGHRSRDGSNASKSLGMVTERGKEQILLSLQRKHGPAETSISTRWNWLWTSDFQNCERTNVF